MDKPRHPNVIRTWNVRRPARVMPQVKQDIDRRFPASEPKSTQIPRKPHPKTG